VDVPHTLGLLSVLTIKFQSDAGLDRLIAVLAGIDSIRDVIAFPKTKSGTDVLVGSPSEIDETILQEYHLSLTSPPSMNIEKSQ
jgi:tRNA synthetases class II (D, K and N)